jgi:uncharacterized protein
MTTIPHGAPCWYELGTNDLDGAGRFYSSVLHWTVADAGMPAFTYHLATASDGAMVAGLMSNAHQDGSPPPNWVVYFTTRDCDETAASIRNAGGSVFVEPSDIPGTGRFAVVSDPQGAVFGILQPLPMDDDTAGGRAFDQSSAGHGGWHELMSPEPSAGFDFYATQFGWTKGDTVDMGDMGTYQVVQHAGADIGGMMGLGNSPVPVWLTYFGVDNTDAAIERINAAGGAVQHGPVEVPGGAIIAIATDPQGAWFAVLGPPATDR